MYNNNSIDIAWPIWAFTQNSLASVMHDIVIVVQRYNVMWMFKLQDVCKHMHNVMYIVYNGKRTEYTFCSPLHDKESCTVAIHQHAKGNTEQYTQYTQ